MRNRVREMEERVLINAAEEIESGASDTVSNISTRTDYGRHTLWRIPIRADVENRIERVQLSPRDSLPLE